eukprot:TRINITY_DN10448_c0_g1_i2.p1 TRINITY_DN10448_c0_g1~~TRINITY_DN10448_c0_g1_i2.p1  ORF type:complete len:757 (-),score=119.19 TRINITY_DN10448_c0_g1_i2:718-2988(-)
MQVPRRKDSSFPLSSTIRAEPPRGFPFTSPRQQWSPAIETGGDSSLASLAASAYDSKMKPSNEGLMRPRHSFFNQRLLCFLFVFIAMTAIWLIGSTGVLENSLKHLQENDSFLGPYRKLGKKSEVMEEMEKFIKESRTILKQLSEKPPPTPLFDPEKASHSSEILNSLAIMGQRLTDKMKEIQKDAENQKVELAAFSANLSSSLSERIREELANSTGSKLAGKLGVLDSVQTKFEVQASEMEALRRETRDVRELVRGVKAEVMSFRQAVGETAARMGEMEGKMDDMAADVRKQLQAQAKSAHNVTQDLLAKLEKMPLLAHTTVKEVISVPEPATGGGGGAPILEAWQQHTFKPFGVYSFVQFSGYRVSSTSFIAIGMGALRMRDKRIAGPCRWTGSRFVNYGSLSEIYAYEDHNLLYEVVMLMCTLSSPSDAGGFLVGRLDKEEILLFREEDYTVPVDPPTELPINITVCSAPMHGDVPLWAVRQFVEYHRLIGIPHAILFDSLARSDGLLAMFEKDIKEGSVEITAFGGVEEYESWYHGQLLAVQDCIYRTRFTSRWLLLADLDEYFWVRPPRTVASILAEHDDKPGFSHGSYWFSVFLCRPKHDHQLEMGPFYQELEGDAFQVENFVFRWPEPACWQEEPQVDPNLCLSHKGHRKVVMNPRMYKRLGVHGPVGNEGPEMEQLSTEVVAHAHFSSITAPASHDVCNDTVPLTEQKSWWRVDPSFARLVARLRKGYKCDFAKDGCKPLKALPSRLL